MAKNTNDESVEPTVPSNRNRLRTVGWIAGGVLALGATFAAGAAVGHVGEGHRGDDSAVGHIGERQHGPRGGMHDGDRGGNRGHGGERHSKGEMRGHNDGSMPDDTAPAPDVTP